MKLASVSLSGIPTPGQTLVLHYIPLRGGRSSVGYVIRPDDTLETVATGIAETIRNNWLSVFTPFAKGNGLQIVCQDPVDDVSFCTEFYTREDGVIPGTIQVHIE